MGKRIDKAITKRKLNSYQIDNRNSDIINNVRAGIVSNKNPNFINPKTIKTLTIGNKRIKKPLFENNEVLIFGKKKEEKVLARNLFIDSIHFFIEQ